MSQDRARLCSASSVHASRPSAEHPRARPAKGIQRAVRGPPAAPTRRVGVLARARGGRERGGRVRRAGRRLPGPQGRAQRRRHLGDQQPRRLLRPHQQAHRRARRHGLLRARLQPRHRPGRRRRSSASTCPTASSCPLDPAQMRVPDGEEASIPGSPAVGMAGGSLAVLDTATGELWATREDPATGVPRVGDAGRPDRAAGHGRRGRRPRRVPRRHASSPSRPPRTGSSPSPQPAATRLRGGRRPTPCPVRGFSDAVAVTAVGAVPVLLDSATGRLVVVGGARGARCRRARCSSSPGPSASSVLVGAPRRAAVGRPGHRRRRPRWPAPTAGRRRPGQPGPARRLPLRRLVRRHRCRGDRAAATRRAAGRPQALDAQTSDLVFRTNRGQIVLNDRATGHVWDVDSDKPTRLDNWDAFQPRVRGRGRGRRRRAREPGRPASAEGQAGRPRGPARPDHDPAPARQRHRAVGPAAGDPLGARRQRRRGPARDQPRRPDRPDHAARRRGRRHQLRVLHRRRSPVGLGARHRAGGDHRRRRRPTPSPALREGFEPRVWTVPVGRHHRRPRAPRLARPRGRRPRVDRRRRRAVGGRRRGADARITAAGAVRFRAPAEGGLVQVEYDVSDGLGEPVTESLDFRVQEPDDLEPVAPIAEPDVIAGETGKPIIDHARSPTTCPAPTR